MHKNKKGRAEMKWRTVFVSYNVQDYIIHHASQVWIKAIFAMYPVLPYPVWNSQPASEKYSPTASPIPIYIPVNEGCHVQLSWRVKHKQSVIPAAMATIEEPSRGAVLPLLVFPIGMRFTAFSYILWVTQLSSWTRVCSFNVGK